MAASPLDCVIIGAGPAGLTAAIYLARFHLTVMVIDAGHSRAASIPKTRNHAGFPEGISGPNLLRRMNQQARIYGAQIERGEVTAIAIKDGLFQVSATCGNVAARSVLLATGVVNIRPDIAPELHDKALAHGLLRYCPICDAYEVTDRPVGVIGSGAHGVREAMFLRGYTADLTLIAADGAHDLDEEQRTLLDEAGIIAIDGPAHDFQLAVNQIQVETAAGTRSFASIYPALGSVIRSEFARALGAEASEEGCLVATRTNAPAWQGSMPPAMWSGGSTRSAMMGEGGVAAATIRNDLAAKSPILR